MPLPRLSYAFFWTLILLVAVATTGGVAVLYEIAQRETYTRGLTAAYDELTQLQSATASTLDDVLDDTITALASFHDEGLAYQLARWDENRAPIVGTFRWHPETGYFADPTLTWEGNVATEIAAMLREPDGADNPFRVSTWSMRDNPDFGSGDLGYQAENLDLVREAGRTAEPIAGWARHKGDPAAPWVMFYRTGPAEPVRGALVDTAGLRARLQELAGRTAVAHVDLVAATDPDPADTLQSLPILGLPTQRLRLRFGDAFVSRQHFTQLAGLTVGFLLILTLIGAAMLTLQSRRDARDAARKTTFVSRVSHELRTPLTSIRMFADMLDDPALPAEKRARYLTTLRRESLRLGDLIERLLAFNALEKGKQSVHLESVELASLVGEVLDGAAPALAAAGLRTDYEPPVAPVLCTTDSTAVRQALANLLDNAAKYAGTGGPIDVTLKTGNNTAVIAVADHGPGIPRAQRERIFEAFVQGTDNLADKAPGLGLGLAIARETLRAIGADLVLASADNGATFEIRLPLPSSA